MGQAGVAAADRAASRGAGAGEATFAAAAADPTDNGHSPRALFITRGQLSITHGFIGITGVVVHAFQRAAADGSFGKAMEAGMNRGQTLVQARVTRCRGKAPNRGTTALSGRL